MRARAVLRASAALLALGLAFVPAASALAAFPGDNGRIAYEDNAVAGDHADDVFSVMRPARREPAHDTPGKNEFGPTWNPAGRRIAFWRTEAPAGPGNLWVMQPDGISASGA